MFKCIKNRQQNNLLLEQNQKKMEKFIRAVDAFYLREKGVNIDTVDYMKMPDERKKYNLDKVIGNGNLTENRYTIKSEVTENVDEFFNIVTTLP